MLTKPSLRGASRLKDPALKIIPAAEDLNVPIYSDDDITLYKVLFLRNQQYVKAPEKITPETKKKIFDTINSIYKNKNKNNTSMPNYSVQLSSDPVHSLLVSIPNDFANHLPKSISVPLMDENDTTAMLFSLDINPDNNRFIHGHWPLHRAEIFGPTTGSPTMAPASLRHYIEEQGGLLQHWYRGTADFDEDSVTHHRVVFSALFPVGARLADEVTLNPESLSMACFFCKEIGHPRYMCTKPDPCHACGSQSHLITRCPLLAKENLRKRQAVVSPSLTTNQQSYPILGDRPSRFPHRSTTAPSSSPKSTPGTQIDKEGFQTTTTKKIQQNQLLPQTMDPPANRVPLQINTQFSTIPLYSKTTRRMRIFPQNLQIRKKTMKFKTIHPRKWRSMKTPGPLTYKSRKTRFKTLQPIPINQTEKRPNSNLTL